MRRILLFCLSTNFICTLQAQCDSSYFRYTGTFICDVSLIDTSKIIAVGDNGYIIKSTDGGKNWRNINSYNFHLLQSVFFPSANVGYTVGSYKTILKTEDQGETWFPLVAKLTTGSTSIFSSFTDVFFFDEQRGCIVGSDGKYITTTDGGRNWKDTTLSLFDGFSSIQFIDDSVGFVCGSSSSFYKTVNGGRTWQRIPIGVINQFQSLRKVRFISTSTGFIIGDIGLCLKTTDGGITWTKIITPTSGSLADIYFHNGQDGFIVGYYDNGLILKTTDGGNTWNSLNNFTNSSSSFYSISADPAKKKIIIAGGGASAEFLGYNGRNIISTTDLGASFTSISRNGRLRYYDAFFLNDSTGYIAGESGTILRTYDYAESWKPLANIPAAFQGNPARKIQFLDSLNGFASTDLIYKTSDGGNSWTSTVIPNNQAQFIAVQMHFFDTQKGLIVDSRNVFKTINGGSNWTNVTSTGDNYFYTDLTVAPNGKAFTVGYGGNVQVSTDEGSSWSSLNLNTSKFLTSVYFYDNNLGFIGTADSTILKTTDGGNTWTTINTGLVGWFVRSFRFVNPSVGYMGLDNNGGFSRIYKTTNGGLTWYLLRNESEYLSRLHGFSTIYAGGGTGMILKLTSLEKPGMPGYLYGPDKGCVGNSSIFFTGDMFGLNHNWSLSGGGVSQVNRAIDTVNWNSAGLHTLTLTVSNACGVSPSRAVTSEVIAFNPVITLQDSILTATEGRSYKWYRNGGPLTPDPGPYARSIIGRVDGSYSVEVESYYGCIDLTPAINYTGIPVVICPPVGSTSINSNLTGQYYNWQMSTGPGFTNIDNNAFFSGAFTQVLQLSNIPSSWYGYKFRCLSGYFNSGTFSTSNTFVLEFRNIWTGFSGSAWEDPTNWSCGSVPDSNSHVVINGGTVIINSNITIRKLTLNNSANLIVSPGNTLTITH